MFIKNRDSNNDNNNSKNLTDIRTEFEALKTFLMKELCHLKQQVKKLNIEQVSSGKERYKDIFQTYLQSNIKYLRKENEKKKKIQS